MDKIYIRDLEFIGYHGVFEEEKKIGQKFFVSLELTTNLRNHLVLYSQKVLFL